MVIDMTTHNIQTLQIDIRLTPGGRRIMRHKKLTGMEHPKSKAYEARAHGAPDNSCICK